MRVINKMKKSVSVLAPNGQTFEINPESASNDVVASPTLIKTLINIYSPDQIQFEFGGPAELAVQDVLTDNIELYVKK